MGEINFTPSQRRAVMARGGPVLVSAAAGSGKTRVLTERLMARVMEGEDICRFLVITFTRAAAAQLRGRILSELNARSAADPSDKRLRRQSALLYRAQIGTIDSFCRTLVRENAHLLGISPDFAILDEERGENMRARALEDVLDRAYERIGTDERLRELVDGVGAGQDDRRLARLVLELHRKMQSHAFPERWAAEMLAQLDGDWQDAAQTPWGRELLDDMAAEALYVAQALEDAAAAMTGPGMEPMLAAWEPAFSELALRLRDAARAARESWDAAYGFLSGPLPRRKALKNFEDEQAKQAMDKVWKTQTARVRDLAARMGGLSGPLLAGAAATRGPLEAMMELVQELDREFAARKRRANACDFSDVTHFCVRLLCDEQGGPTALAAAVSDRFAEVMVDEYQDVNAVQELIFRRVSHEGRDLFTVGDVKQAIYRFRLAEPDNFLRRYEDFADGKRGERVLLRENFRSRAAVLDGCNSVFRRVMSGQLGEVEYNDEAALVCGSRDYPPEGEVMPELCVLDRAGPDGEDAPDKTLLEARYVARRIRAMVEAGEPVSDGNGGLRPVRYGDIALLLRAPRSSGGAYVRALGEAGVPVSARQSGAFFNQPEVSFVLSMLAVADNPRQDVPLIAALRGLPFGFTPDELAAVRAASPGELWDALCLRAEQDERCARFTALVRRLRSLAREESTDALLRRLYDETRLLTVCSAMTDAPQRLSRLMQLYEYARQFESEGGRGLFRFVGWLRDLADRRQEPPAPAEDDAVQLMSIHKSKGLEWPVVFLADNGHGWNRTQGADHVVCHRRLGLGMRVTDRERGVHRPTLPWLAITRAENREDMSEQVRLLYVAMTRAKERLIMTCVADRTALAGVLEDGPSAAPLSPRLLLRSGSPADWLIRAAVRDGGEHIRLVLVDRPGEEPVRETAAGTVPPAEEELVRDIGRRLAWRYPYEGAVALPSKLTATSARELAPGTADPEAAALPRTGHAPAALRRPDFGRLTRPLTGPERGVAAHLVMQYIDFARTGSVREVDGEIARLERMGLLDARQAAAVDREDILAFFRSALGQRLLAADRVIREFRFSLLCPASLWYPDAGQEQVLLQGVVDCCMEEDGALTVVDFKTDGHADPDRYAGQLQAYAAAMERIFQMPVRQTALWYLRLRREADIPLAGK